MQKFSKEEMQEQAAKFMAAHNVDSFLATEDGNFFHPKDKSLAHDHNFKNVKGEVYEFAKQAAAEKEDIVIDPADAVEEEVITPVHISEDVERHGEPVPAKKPAAEKKPTKKK